MRVLKLRAFQDQRTFDYGVHEDHLAEQEYAAALAAAVADLPPRPREIFVMSRQRGLSYGEIASALGLSRKTVEGHMVRALRDVRARLRHLVF